MTTDDRSAGDVPYPGPSVGPGGTAEDGSREITVPVEIPLVDGRVEIALSLALIVFGALAIVSSQTIRTGSIPDPIGSDGFPVLAGGFLMVVGTLQVIRQIRFLRGAPGNLVPAAGADTDEPGYQASTLRAFAMFGAGFAWAFALPVAGFLVPTILIGVAGIILMEVESWPKRLLVPLITALVMWLVFNQVFGIQFPAGPVERFLDGLLPSMRI